MDERNRLAPVSLAVEGPVLHLVLDALAADALLLKVLLHLLNGVLLVRHAVKHAGIDHLAVARVGFLRDVSAFDDLDDLRAEFLRKVIVALVVRGYGHDGSGAIPHHDIIGYKERDPVARDGIDGGQAVQLHAGLVLHELRALEFRLLGGFLPVLLYVRPVRNPVLIFVQQRMLRGNDHERHAVERVAPRGINLELLVRNRRPLPVRDIKVNERAGGAADPGNLLLLDGIRIIHGIEAIEELVRVGRDFQEPHVLRQLHDIAVADVALAALGVLVGQDHLAVRAVVDERLRAEHEPVFEQLQENPLRPLVVVRVGRREFPRPVKREADLLQLVGKVRDILLRDDMRMRIRLDGVVFRGKAERIKADREQDVIALHAAFSREHLNGAVGFDMSYMHTLAGRIRELHESVPLRLFVKIHRLERIGVGPCLLPFRLNFTEVVFHAAVPHFPAGITNKIPDSRLFIS